MIRKLFVTTALLGAILIPVGVAAASSVDNTATAQDPVQTQTTVQTQNPNCDGTCDGAGPGAGPLDGSGPLHVGPMDGTGNRFGANGEGGNAMRGGFGAGARDGAGPIHVGPADGSGNRFGVANGTVTPDDGFVCDGTRRHSPNGVTETE